MEVAWLFALADEKASGKAVILLKDTLVVVRRYGMVFVGKCMCQGLGLHPHAANAPCAPLTLGEERAGCASFGATSPALSA